MKVLLVLLLFSATANAARIASPMSPGDSAESSVRPVTITSIPQPASLFVDSIPVGYTPVDLRLRPGIHALRVASADTAYELIETHFYVAIGPQPLTLTVRLTKKFVSVVFARAQPGDSLSIEALPVYTINDSVVMYHYGTYRAAARNMLSGREVHQVISFPAGADYSVRPRLGYPSILPILYSAVVPGLGQCNDGALIEAAGFFAGTVGASIFYASSLSAFEKAHSDYTSAIAAYNAATTESGAVMLRKQVEDAHAQTDRKLSTQHLSVAVLLGIYAANLLDTILFHARDDEIQVLLEVPATSAVESPGSGSLSLRVQKTLTIP
ncbi:MAG TPA: DUF5683 domain-containing protein [Bacteroidota bacterium]|nr:DUF5683 domain-containing protein [Bacteroidota bacterium]